MAKAKQVQETAPAPVVVAEPVAAPVVAAEPVAAAPAPAPKLLYAGKVPSHRAGHNATAWAAIAPLLPATADALAALPEVKACGGSKANGHLMVGYCLRRGWLTETAPAPAAAPAEQAAPATEVQA